MHFAGSAGATSGHSILLQVFLGMSEGGIKGHRLVLVCISINLWVFYVFFLVYSIIICKEGGGTNCERTAHEICAFIFIQMKLD